MKTDDLFRAVSAGGIGLKGARTDGVKGGEWLTRPEKILAFGKGLGVFQHRLQLIHVLLV